MKRYWIIGVALLAINAKPKDSLPVAQPMTASDKAIGAKAHSEILAQFGGLYTQGKQADYVRGVGQKIASQSGLSNTKGDFTVSLLNSSVNNAFALPGGYVYVTRQLLGLMNDEAELASVMGHEVGHVAARHSKKRQNRATIGGIGAIAATVLGSVLGGEQGAKLGQSLGGTLAQGWVMSFSRAQEYQADDLGVSYLARGGYDPIAASSMLASLAAQSSLEAKIQGRGDQKSPNWASTHPDPASRVTRAAQRATVSAPTGKLRNRDAFLSAIDGMMYDDDPHQGMVDGQEFRHPDLKLGFTAPAGFALSNGSDAVTISGSTGQAQFSGAKYDGNLESYVASVFKTVGGETVLNFGKVQRTTINGLGAAYASATANAASGPVVVTVYAYEFAPDTAYHLFSITPSASGRVFDSLFASVRRLSASEAAAVKPRSVRVVSVSKGDTIASLATRMAYRDFRTERFLTLNALAANAVLKPGQKVKIITW